MSEGGITRRRFLKIGGALAATVVVGGVATTAATLAPEVGRPSMRMGEGIMKTLVVYATKSGSVTQIAEHIGKTLAARGATVDVATVDKVADLAGYDAVVVGSGVRGGQWHEDARAWVEANAATLASKPVAFYTVGMTMAVTPEKADEVRAYTDPLAQATGVKPVDVGLFAGWNEPKQFSMIERTIMKLMKAPQGDFRDFAAVDAWAEKLAPELGV